MRNRFLATEEDREGTYISESLDRLFQMIWEGYPKKGDDEAMQPEIEEKKATAAPSGSRRCARICSIRMHPMNALATDQAPRIADLIHTIPALAGLRAGLYIGAADDAPTAAMTATSVITDKEVSSSCSRCNRRW